MNGRLPTEEEQRTLTQAGDFIDDQLGRLVRDRYPQAKFSNHMVRSWKEEGSFVGATKSPIVVSVPVNGKPTEIDITDPMKEACESILPPLVESMFDLLSRVDPEYQETVRNNVVVSGGTGLIRGLGPRLEQEMAPIGGGKVRVVKDPVYIGSDGGLAIALDAPESDWEKLSGS
jgi:rod shape-determining protein MreB